MISWPISSISKSNENSPVPLYRTGLTADNPDCRSAVAAIPEIGYEKDFLPDGSIPAMYGRDGFLSESRRGSFKPDIMDKGR
jgi:hypothetical protein